MNSRLNIAICDLIYVVLYIYLALDILAGILLSLNISNYVSIPMKAMLLILMLFMEIRYKRILGFLGILFFFSCISVFHLIYIGKTAGAISGIFKLLYCPVMYCFFMYYCNQKKVLRILKNNTFILVLNIFLGVLGFGFKTYRNQAGIKGFFYSGNELSIIVFCMFVYWYIQSDKSNKVVAFFVIISFVVGTKAAVFAVVLYYILIKLSVKKERIIVSLISLSTILLLIVINKERILALSIVKFHIDKMRWNSIRNGTIVNNILSGRITYMKNLLEYVSNHISLRSILWGYGVPTKTAEIDIVDSLFAYGLVVCFFILVFYLYVLYVNRQNRNILVFNTIYLLLSFTAGHVWFNTTSMLFFCILNTSSLDGSKKLNLNNLSIFQLKNFEIKTHR